MEKPRESQTVDTDDEAQAIRMLAADFVAESESLSGNPTTAAEVLDSAKATEDAAPDFETLVSRVGMVLHDEGFPVSVDATKQIVKTILRNKTVLDFLART